MGTEQETKERESSRTSLHPGRANSGNLPVALHSKRQPISPSVATPSWLRPCRNEGVELEKRQRKLQLNIGVHSNSNAAGRGSGANAVGPSGAMSASAGNCGWWPTWCQGTLCFFLCTLPMVPSRVGGPTAPPQRHISGLNCFVSSAPWW